MAVSVSKVVPNAIVAPEGATGARLTDLGDPKSLAAATPCYSSRRMQSRANLPSRTSQKVLT